MIKTFINLTDIEEESTFLAMTDVLERLDQEANEWCKENKKKATSISITQFEDSGGAGQTGVAYTIVCENIG